MKRGFLGSSEKEPADSWTILKSTREVSIYTLQATTIDNVDQKSIDNNITSSIDITCEKVEKVEVLMPSIAEKEPIYITLMEQCPFHGFPHEQPMDHINIVGEKYPGIKFLQTPGRTLASGSSLERTLVPRIPARRKPSSRYGIFRVWSQDRPLPLGNEKLLVRRTFHISKYGRV